MHNCRECKFKSIAARCLTDNELDSLDNDSVEVRFKKGDLIFKQDALSLNITYLRTGLVKVHMKGPNSEKIMRIVKAPAYLGISTTFGDKVNHYSATALDDTTVCFLDANVFKSLTQKNKLFAYEIILDLCQNELADYHRCLNQSQKQIPGRIAETLLFFSQNIYNATSFNLPITRDEFGQIVGTSRESISRILSEFTDAKIIDTSAKEIDIINQDMLEQISKNG